jgi:SAM-dependent methyltransferase
VDAAAMERFWDARAAEDPFYFVDNRQRYRGPDHRAFWESGREALERIDSLLGVRVGADDDVVEIGCGIGRLTRALAARARSVRALDISERMLAQARELNPQLANVEWLHGDGSTLSGVVSASADACYSFVVFQHIPDPGTTLGYVREIGRVLRPGGFAALQVSNRPDIHRRPRAARRVAGSMSALLRRAPGGQAHPAWLGSAVDLGEIARAAADGGMRIEWAVGAGTQYCLVRTRKDHP